MGTIREHGRRLVKTDDGARFMGCPSNYQPLLLYTMPEEFSPILCPSVGLFHHGHLFPCRFSRLPPPVGPAGTSVISRFVSSSPATPSTPPAPTLVSVGDPVHADVRGRHLASSAGHRSGSCSWRIDSTAAAATGTATAPQTPKSRPPWPGPSRP